jgi:hypothetical protein
MRGSSTILGMAGQSFPWLGRLANNAGHYLPSFVLNISQTKENEADTKKMEGSGYRKNRMDGH